MRFRMFPRRERAERGVKMDRQKYKFLLNGQLRIVYIIFNRNSTVCELIVQKTCLPLHQKQQEQGGNASVVGLDRQSFCNVFQKNFKIMEKNIILTKDTKKDIGLGFEELANRLGSWAAEPVRLLGEYYSGILERQLSMKQTWRMIEVQLAFLSCLFPADLPAAVRLLTVVWLVWASIRCKRAMK